MDHGNESAGLVDEGTRKGVEGSRACYHGFGCFGVCRELNIEDSDTDLQEPYSEKFL